VAFIMDGNGRWAVNRGLSRRAGHQAGLDTIKRVLEHLHRRGVQFVTIYAFSTENWKRPADEVQWIMDLLQDGLGELMQDLHRNNVRVRHLGRADRLDSQLREGVEQALNLTRDNTGITLNVAFDYGGRDEILQACRQIVQERIPDDLIDEKLFGSYLYTAGTPDPDLIIRTGGELRLSNFLLWQSAYSEYYPTPVLWPDLDADELDNALTSYQNRHRRFGRVTTDSPG
jgi:undecaprenyl diphosphate synthase